MSLFEESSTPTLTSDQVTALYDRLASNSYPTYRRAMALDQLVIAEDFPVGVVIASTPGEITDVYLSVNGELVVMATELFQPVVRHVAIEILHVYDTEGLSGPRPGE